LRLAKKSGVEGTLAILSGEGVIDLVPKVVPPGSLVGIVIIWNSSSTGEKGSISDRLPGKAPFSPETRVRE
jgi:hypothetical protein